MDNFKDIISRSYRESSEEYEANKAKLITETIEETRRHIKAAFGLDLRETGELLRLRIICTSVVEQIIDEARKKSTDIYKAGEPESIGGPGDFGFMEEAVDRYMHETFGFYPSDGKLDITPAFKEHLKSLQRKKNSGDEFIENFDQN